MRRVGPEGISGDIRVTTTAPQRRLAAIVAADVAGYTRLMADDEPGTLAALKAHRAAAIDPPVGAHGGHVVKSVGDGLLLEFPSVVEAVACTIDIQRRMAERNRDVPPGRRIVFRIGVNIGDIIVDDGDMFGDGVNLAARLEQIAEPGGICLSDDAWRQVRGKIDLPATDGGVRRLRHVANPVRVYRIPPPPDAAAAPGIDARLTAGIAAQRSAAGFAGAVMVAAGIAAAAIWYLADPHAAYHQRFQSPVPPPTAHAAARPAPAFVSPPVSVLPARHTSAGAIDAGRRTRYNS